MKPSLLGNLFLMRRLEKSLTTTDGGIFCKVQPLFPRKHKSMQKGNGLGLSVPRRSFLIDGLHGLQKEVNEMM